MTKFKLVIAAVMMIALALAGPSFGASATVMADQTTGVLRAPANFFSGNAAALQALAQTPWATDINGNGKALTNVVSITSSSTNAFAMTMGDGGTHRVRLAMPTNSITTNYDLLLPNQAFAGPVMFAVSGPSTNPVVTLTAVTNVYEFALGDETTAITTGTAKLTWRAPFAFTVRDVRASLGTVSSSGLPTVNIKESGTTIFSAKLTIDANEKTSTTAATPYVLSDTSIADDAEITFDIDVAGTGAAGLKVKIYFTR